MACAGMSQLERVDLGWCSSVTDADVKALARLPLLCELDLSRTQVSCFCFTSCAKSYSLGCL